MRSCNQGPEECSIWDIRVQDESLRLQDCRVRVRVGFLEEEVKIETSRVGGLEDKLRV